MNEEHEEMELNNFDPFLKLIINTGQTMRVRQEDINSELWQTVITISDQLFSEYVANLPIPGDYCVCAPPLSDGFAGFAINKDGLLLSDCYLATEHGDLEWIWGYVQRRYFDVTDKSEMHWPLPPEQPPSTPYLAVIRYEADLDCEPFVGTAIHDRPLKDICPWLPDLESAMGLLLLKELYEDEAE